MLHKSVKVRHIGREARRTILLGISIACIGYRLGVWIAHAKIKFFILSHRRSLINRWLPVVKISDIDFGGLLVTGEGDICNSWIASVLHCNCLSSVYFKSVCISASLHADRQVKIAAKVAYVKISYFRHSRTGIAHPQEGTCYASFSSGASNRSIYLTNCLFFKLLLFFVFCFRSQWSF